MVAKTLRVSRILRDLFRMPEMSIICRIDEAFRVAHVVRIDHGTDSVGQKSVFSGSMPRIRS
jgi:hypothetical protein